jgi:hypothetical protein
LSLRSPLNFFAPIEEGGPWGFTLAAPRGLPPGGKKDPQGPEKVKKLEGWAGCLSGRLALAPAPAGGGVVFACPLNGHIGKNHAKGGAGNRGCQGIDARGIGN